MTHGSLKDKFYSLNEAQEGPWRPGQGTHLDQQSEGLWAGDTSGHGEVARVSVNGKCAIFLSCKDGGKAWPLAPSSDLRARVPAGSAHMASPLGFPQAKVGRVCRMGREAGVWPALTPHNAVEDTLVDAPIPVHGVDGPRT